ncbi:MAG TPA: hypothetical protein VH637_24840 [Streptosporangiaceae bacterium]|jgi:hypothetical protein
MIITATAVEPLAKIITDISDNLVEVYKHKTELEERRYLAELEHATRAAQRQHEAAESERSRQYLLTQAREQREHEVRRIWEQARVDLWYSAEKDKSEARKAVYPFSVPPDDLTRMAARFSRGGERPMLIFAPFSDESMSAAESDSGPLRYRVGPRNSWAASPWSDDAEPVDGLFSRPLYHGDLDIYLVQEVLDEFAVVLVNGHVQAGARLWLTMSAWGILPGGAGIRVQFPYLDLPSMAGLDTDGARQAQLDVEDQISARFAPVAAQLFDWYHLTRRGRPPRLHRTLPAELAGQRAAIAAGNISGFFVAERNHVLSHPDALLGAARVAAEGGLERMAAQLARDLSATLRDEPESIRDDTAAGLAALAALARESGDLDLAATAYQILEQVTRRLMRELPGGGL